MFIDKTVQPWLSRFGALVLGLTFIVSASPAPAATGTSSSTGFGDESRAVGVAYLCQGVLRGISRMPSQPMPMQRIYAAGLQDIDKATRFSFGGSTDIAKAIGIIRGTQAEETSRQPSAAVALETQVKQCLADLKKPKLSSR